MGSEKSLQFYSDDGCVYVYNTSEKRWYKLCPAGVLPKDVRGRIQELKETADALKETPPKE